MIIRQAGQFAGVMLAAAVACAATFAEAPIRLEGMRKTQPAPASPDKKTLSQTNRPPQKIKKIKKTAPPGQTEKPTLSAEAIARLRRMDKDVPVTLPQGWQPRGKAKKTFPSEGTTVINRIGRIVKENESDWWVVTFENNRQWPYQAPRRLLPCRLLEKIESQLRQNPKQTFRLTGETAIDLEHAYLLLQRVTVMEEEAPARPGETNAPPRTEKNGATPPPAAAKGSTEALMQELLKERPGKAVLLVPSAKPAAGENLRSVAPADKIPFSHGKRNLVVDRIIRVIRGKEGTWWEGHFESDNTLREPPVRILPGMQLVRIRARMQEMGSSDLQLRVSGEITTYNGRRYLMLRKVLEQRDMDQF